MIEQSVQKILADTPRASSLVENLNSQILLILYREGLERVDIQTRFGDNIPTLRIDHQHMKQAFINLVDNAVYAVNKDGTIVFDLSYDGILKIVRVEIADSGKGISDKEKTKLFEPYFSTKRSGTGLGLAIVKHIVQYHNGKINVESTKGRGSCFNISLPHTVNLIT